MPPPPRSPLSQQSAGAPPHIELIVRGLLCHGGKLLLCKSTSRGYFYLPGGHVDPGESAPAALAREFLEETGLAVTPGRLLLVTEAVFAAKRPHHELNLVFHVEPAGPAAALERVASLEPGIDFTWVAPDDPGLDIRPPAVRAHLARLCTLAGSGNGTVEWGSDIP